MAITDKIIISNLYYNSTTPGSSWDWSATDYSYVSKDSYGTIIELDISSLSTHDRITKLAVSAFIPHVEGSGQSDYLIGELFSSLDAAKKRTNQLDDTKTVTLENPNSYYGKFTLDFDGLDLNVNNLNNKLFIRIWTEDSSLYTFYRYGTGDFPAPQVSGEVLSGCAKIKTADGIKIAIPCIYTNGAWRRAVPYSYAKASTTTSPQWYVCG